MTEFQRRIAEFLPTCLNGMASTWEIAQKVFPEKWARPSCRGALVGHIVRAGHDMERIGAIAYVLPAQDQHGGAKLCAHNR